MLLLMALLAGIVTMHAITVTPAHDPAPSTTTTAAHHAMDRHTHSADQSCQDNNCGQHHTGLHACVFIMTAIPFVAGLALLCWVGITRATLTAPQLQRRCRRRQRAPPWTVLSLSELSILRI
jgi:Family of unknown function (DUF6153)